MKPATNRSHPLSHGNDAGVNCQADGGMAAALRRLAGLVDGCPLELAQSPEDLKAITWMWQSLEDLEATIIGLSQGTLPPFQDDWEYQSSPAASLMS